MEGFQTLMMIPKQDLTNDFFVVDVDVCHHEYSSFNTYDFQKTVRPFNKYNYRMKKILERVKDLAIMHSCINQFENQKLVYEKFKNFMAYHFTDEVEELATKLHIYGISLNKKAGIEKRIARLTKEIHKCKIMWEQHAPSDVWDS